MEADQPFAGRSPAALTITRKHWAALSPDFKGGGRDGASILVLNPRRGGSELWPVSVVDAAALDYTALDPADPQHTLVLTIALRTRAPCRVSPAFGSAMRAVGRPLWENTPHWIYSPRAGDPILCSESSAYVELQSMTWPQIVDAIGDAYRTSMWIEWATRPRHRHPLLP